MNVDTEADSNNANGDKSNGKESNTYDETDTKVKILIATTITLMKNKGQ